MFPGPAREVVLAPARDEVEMRQACALATHGTMDADIFALARFVTGREWGRDLNKIRLAKRMLSKYQKILTENANAKEDDTGLAREPADPLNHKSGGQMQECPVRGMDVLIVSTSCKDFSKAGSVQHVRAGAHSGLAREPPGLAQMFKQWKRIGKGRWWKKLMMMYLMLSEDRTTFNFTGGFVRPWVGKLLDRDQQKEYNRKQEAKAAKDKAKAKPAVAKAKAQGKGQGQ